VSTAAADSRATRLKILRQEMRALGQIATDTVGTDNGVLADTVLRGQIAAFEIDALAFRLTIDRAGDMAKVGQAHPAVSSLLKYYGTELNERRMELVMSAGGTDALKCEGERSREGARVDALP
jgi:hypothetical protein